MRRPTAYIESSVVSYYVARRSRDLIVLSHQEITCTWWNAHLHEYEACISQAVLDEIGRGDPAAARHRIEAVSHLPLVPVLNECERLAMAYARHLGLPASGLYDALHIAIASVHRIEYLVTWNCAHIANAHMRRGLGEVNGSEGFPLPVICTPEELLDDDAFSSPDIL